MKSFFSEAWSFITGAKFWLIAVALTGAVAFAGGWYSGSTHEAGIMAKAAVQAAQVAQAAQAKKDAADWKIAKADYEKRLAVNQKADVVYQTIYRDRVKLVPNPTKASVSAAAMKALNDPDLVGETQ